MSAYVVFFGGYRATLDNIKSWRGSAMQAKPHVTFDGFPYPSGAPSDGDKALEAFKKANDYDRALKAISDSNADKIYIVGHSSGCAIANAVDDGVKDHSKVILVALDGYAPSPAQLERASTQVWSAECGHATSLNYYRLKEKVKARLQIYKATNCYHKWALHFSLVNVAASDDVVKEVTDGYKNCQANLMWM